jgi:hypothetical protein
MIPRDYVPHGQPLKYMRRGKNKWMDIYLSPKAEEAASLYALLPKHHRVDKQFKSTFFDNWKRCFINANECLIHSIDKCDFVSFKTSVKDHVTMVYDDEEEKYKYVLVTYVDSNGVLHEDEKIELSKYKVASTFIHTHRGPDYGEIRWPVRPKSITLNVNDPEDASDCDLDEMNKKCLLTRDVEGFWVAKWPSYVGGRNYYAKFNVKKRR